MSVLKNPQELLFDMIKDSNEKIDKLSDGMNKLVVDITEIKGDIKHIKSWQCDKRVECDKHLQRTIDMEKSVWKWMGGISAISAALTLGAAFLIKLI